MSTPSKTDLARGWKRAEALLDEEADRLAKMSDEDFAREMAAEPALGEHASPDALLARAKARAQARQGGALVIRPARKSWRWTAAVAGLAAVAAAAALVVGRGSDGNVAATRADALRKQALGECDAKAWVACVKDLDDAKELDPKGDAAPAIQDARRKAQAAMAPPGGGR